MAIGKATGQWSDDSQTGTCHAGDSQRTTLRVAQGDRQVGGHVENEQVYANGSARHQADRQQGVAQVDVVAQPTVAFGRLGFVGFRQEATDVPA
ncbi:hypothetical protein D3C86_1638820 [compost metagenome]